VAKHIKLDETEQAQFISFLEFGKIKNKKHILTEGEVCKQSYFVVSGCLRGYTIDQNGFEHVLSFAPTGWWMGDIYSLITQKPGILNIEALEETHVLSLSKINQDKLYELIPKFERFFRIIVEKSLVANQQRLLDNMSLSAEERYKNFCKRYPQLINTLPQKQIALYIGVTPEFFSKMKAKLLKKKD
ncbi:MAG: Crp/Fnr family transcriptional regulator, partial [Bacteroidetes bacterium]|nr:Crp/Fnr family transcriptional regulator [Bacteroidota bacterium]